MSFSAVLLLQIFSSLSALLKVFSAGQEVKVKKLLKTKLAWLTLRGQLYKKVMTITCEIIFA